MRKFLVPLAALAAVLVLASCTPSGFRAERSALDIAYRKIRPGVETRPAANGTECTQIDQYRSPGSNWREEYVYRCKPSGSWASVFPRTRMVSTYRGSGKAANSAVVSVWQESNNRFLGSCSASRRGSDWVITDCT